MRDVLLKVVGDVATAKAHGAGVLPHRRLVASPGTAAIR